MAISLHLLCRWAASSLPRLLSTFGLGESPTASALRRAYDRIGDCSREDCPVHPAPGGCVSVALEWGPHPPARPGVAARSAGLSTRIALPRLSPGTLLCAARTFL